MKKNEGETRKNIKKRKGTRRKKDEGRRNPKEDEGTRRNKRN